MRVRDNARVKTLGWPYPASPRPWSELAAEYSNLGPSNESILAIIESVQESELSTSLAAFTSMLDLMVVEYPLRELPYDVIAIRARTNGTVEIEHLSISGRNDRITRPVDAAVPLFWRFVEEKFGLQSIS